MALEARYEGTIPGSLDWEVRRRELEHAGEAEVETGQRETLGAARKRRREAAQVRRRSRMPILGILGAAAAVGLMVALLMGYIELTRLSTETVRLKTQLETLKSENVVLSAKHDRMFDLASVKEAAEAAGMSKPSTSQIGYLDLSGGDSVVIYPHEDPGVLNHLLLSARAGFDAVKEFFG